VKFDAGFFQRYYRDAETRVASREDTLRLGRFICAYASYLGFRVSRALDAGCGLGHMQKAVREHFPRARYVGLDASEYLCRRHGWIQDSIADYAPRAPFDLVICHDVLQYLSDREAARALANLARLCRGAMYFSVLTVEDWRRNADRARTDSGVWLRPAEWYRSRLLRSFRPLGGGLLARRGYTPLLWELERAWPESKLARPPRRRSN
jgi:SAM-dependent methyltransferase